MLELQGLGIVLLPSLLNGRLLIRACRRRAGKIRFVADAVGKMSRGHGGAGISRRPDSVISDRSLRRAQDGYGE